MAISSAGVCVGRTMSKLYIIATPIGNLEDITLRAMKTLEDIDALACEDTRVTRKIYSRYNITRPEIVFSYRDFNEERAGSRILELLRDGKTVGLCTNAGYPGISDPGYRIISAALREGFEVEVIPGASAVTQALLSSGLPSSSYTFKGFLPKKPGQRKTSLLMEKDGPHFSGPWRPSWACSNTAGSGCNSCRAKTTYKCSAPVKYAICLSGA